MAEKQKTYHIFISAAEPSADSHCAALITALQQSTYNIEFVGVGGPKMASAGCKLLETTVHRAAMAYNAFKHVLHYYKLIKRISRFLKSSNVDLVIVCDSPALNFHIAKAAAKANIKTLFYVAPQLWVWAGWRIRKLRKYCYKLCCILPFEQDWFSRKGIDTVFVGNPLLDELDGNLSSPRKSYTDFDPKNATIALMPGSRAAELDSLWPPMQKIAVRLKKKYPGVTFITAALDEATKEILKSMQILGFRCRYAVGSVAQTARNSDLSIVTSGSATLQVAAAGCPMVIMYQSSRILWHLVGRWLLKTKFLSLVNILADKELVPEFMPYFSSIDPIVQSAENLLSDNYKLTQTSGELTKLVEPLAEKNASQQVAEIATNQIAYADGR